MKRKVKLRVLLVLILFIIASIFIGFTYDTVGSIIAGAAGSITGVLLVEVLNETEIFDNDTK